MAVVLPEVLEDQFVVCWWKACVRRSNHDLCSKNLVRGIPLGFSGRLHPDVLVIRHHALG
jgi:hypothetical protein